MTTDATLSTFNLTHHQASSTRWFWWKETRQLAPLVLLLIIVALMILMLNAVIGLSMNKQSFQVPHEVMMLVFPGLFATGAGPLLIGQERAQRTIDWLALLPISAKRIVTTKLLVAISGLVVMWVVAILFILGFELQDQNSPGWIVGQRNAYSDNPFSYTVWIIHSLFVLLSGFFVSWRIKNQFYSLIALVPIAFLPMILTGLIASGTARPMTISSQDTINFWITLVGIAVMAPLGYRSALRALGAAPAPGVRPLLDATVHSPARDIQDACSPVFGTQTAPIIWQTIHSAKGMLAILIGMILIGFLATLRLVADDQLQGVERVLPWLLLPAPLAVCWLGVGVFKHDGASERVRFLADRGVSPWKTYFALHAVPIAILSAAALVYGLMISVIIHQQTFSSFAATLPTLLTLLFYVGIVYSVSQWVSQFVRTLILSVILAPILSLMVAVWLSFVYATLAYPGYAVLLSAIIPMIATAVMMPRYMDSRDRPLTFVVATLVVLWLLLSPIAFAAAHLWAIPGMESSERSRLMAEADRLRVETASQRMIPLAYSIPSNSFNASNLLPQDNLAQLQLSLERYERDLDPLNIVRPITLLPDQYPFFTHSDWWQFSFWHGGMMRARIGYRQGADAPAWEELSHWLEATAVLLPALRRSTLLIDQEIADRLEVLLIDTLQTDVSEERRTESAVQSAVAAIGTPDSRAAARRRAVLVTWSFRFQDDQGRAMYHYVHAMDLQPPGLIHWVQPRMNEWFVAVMLRGIEASQSGTDDITWRRALHSLHQTGGVFETSRYGNEMRAMPAVQTMSIDRFSGYGQLWGRDWETVDANSIWVSAK